MDTHQRSPPSDPTITDRKLRFDLGTFAGFNLSNPAAIKRRLTAQEVVDLDGELDGAA